MPFALSLLIEVGFDLLVFLFLIPIDVLGRTCPNPLCHTRVLPSPRFVLDSDDIELMPPIIAKVEPVTEAAAHFQAGTVSRTPERLFDRFAG